MPAKPSHRGRRAGRRCAVALVCPAAAVPSRAPCPHRRFPQVVYDLYVRLEDQLELVLALHGDRGSYWEVAVWTRRRQTIKTPPEPQF